MIRAWQYAQLGIGERMEYLDRMFEGDGIHSACDEPAYQSIRAEILPSEPPIT